MKKKIILISCLVIVLTTIIVLITTRKQKEEVDNQSIQGEDLDWLIKGDDYTEIGSSDSYSYGINYDCLMITRSSNTVLDFPTEFNGEEVYGIMAECFKNNKTIKSAKIPYGFKVLTDCFSNSSIESVEIGDYCMLDPYCFSDCKSLTSVMFTGIESYLSRYCFSGCNALKMIELPDGIECLEVGLFSDCSSLASVTIPESVTDIYADAFKGCSSLTEITLPDSLEYIDENAFDTSLKIVYGHAGSLAEQYANSHNIIFKEVL